MEEVKTEDIVESPENQPQEKKESQQAEQIGQEQFHSYLFSEKMSWQEIIYDLINSEQLDPWDINLSSLSQKYLEKIRNLEEANFALSSKVLLVASLMLRIKSELLMNRYIKDLDDVLFGKKPEQVQQKLRIELEDGEIPELMPRTPLPRFKKISINELMQALNKAIKTETRRDFKKEVEREQFERTKLLMPKKTISLANRVRIINSKIKNLFQKHKKIKFSEFAGPKNQDKIDTFIPLLHLDTHSKLYLHQPEHFKEIWIHPDNKEFEQNDIITNKLEEQFEDSLEKVGNN